MKQKKIVIIMAGILAATAAMTGCAEQNKTATQVDYTQNSQGKSEQTKQKTAEKSQPDKKQVNKSTSIGKEDSNQTADKKTKISASSNNAGDVQNSENGTDSTAGTDTDDSQTTGVDTSASEDNGSTGNGGTQSDQRADQAMIYDSEGNGRLISQADDGNWYDSDGNCYGSWEDIGRAMDEDGVTDQDGNKYYWTWTAPDDASGKVRDPYDLYSWDPGTNSYIPFQAAESDCSPIGRGNGWYYYDKDSGEYVPW